MHNGSHGAICPLDVFFLYVLATSFKAVVDQTYFSVVDSGTVTAVQRVTPYCGDGSLVQQG